MLYPPAGLRDRSPPINGHERSYSSSKESPQLFVSAWSEDFADQVGAISHFSSKCRYLSTRRRAHATFLQQCMALSNKCCAFTRKTGMYGTHLFWNGVCHARDREESTVFGTELA